MHLQLATAHDASARSNADLAERFERRSAAATGYARDQYLRVTRTLRALPFPLRTIEDLDRPELRCVGRGKVRTELQRFLHERG